MVDRKRLHREIVYVSGTFENILGQFGSLRTHLKKEEMNKMVEEMRNLERSKCKDEITELERLEKIKNAYEVITKHVDPLTVNLLISASYIADNLYDLPYLM